MSEVTLFITIMLTGKERLRNDCL